MVTREDNFLFYQDNAAVHRLVKVTSWLCEKIINDLTWPSRYTNLNPITNLCGNLYSSGKQYHDVTLLNNAVKIASENIFERTLFEFVTFMQRLCIAVLLNRGDCIGC